MRQYMFFIFLILGLGSASFAQETNPPYDKFLNLIKAIESGELLTESLVKETMDLPLKNERSRRRNYKVFSTDDYEIRFLDRKGRTYFIFSFKEDPTFIKEAMTRYGFLPPSTALTASGQAINTYRLSNTSYKLYLCDKNEDTDCMHEMRITKSTPYEDTEKEKEKERVSQSEETKKAED